MARGDEFLSPDLRGASRARPSTVLGGARRIVAGNSAAEGSVQYDPNTGRELGRLIVQGTPRSQVVRQQTQEDLFAQILGGAGRDFFPTLDETGLNVSNDYRTLSPDQILALHRAGFTPLGGSPLFEGSAIFGGPEQGTRGSFLGGLSLEQDGQAGASGGGSMLVPLLALAGGLVLVYLLVRRK